jgi:hypothetical protein
VPVSANPPGRPVRRRAPADAFRTRQLEIPMAITPLNRLSLDRAIMAFAGVMILVSIALTQFVSPWFWLFTAFIGLNLLQSAFTGFCPAGMVLRRLGVGRDAAGGSCSR